MDANHAIGGRFEMKSELWIALYAAVIPTLLMEVSRVAFAREVRVMRSHTHKENRIGIPGKTRRCGLHGERRCEWHAHGTYWTLAAIGLIAGFAMSRVDGSPTTTFAGFSLTPTDVTRLTVIALGVCALLLYAQYRTLCSQPRSIKKAAFGVFIVNVLGLCAFSVTLAAIVLDKK